VRVIPILVDGAPIPRENDLPEPLRPLARRQSMRLAHERFGSDADDLVQSLRAVVQPAGKQRSGGKPAEDTRALRRPPSMASAGASPNVADVARGVLIAIVLGGALAILLTLLGVSK